MNRTERALKKQCRRRMEKARDDKNCLIKKKEGVFSPYHPLMKDRSEQIKDLNNQIKDERRDKHTIYANFIQVNENLSHAINNSKEVIGA